MADCVATDEGWWPMVESVGGPSPADGSSFFSESGSRDTVRMKIERRCACLRQWGNSRGPGPEKSQAALRIHPMFMATQGQSTACEYSFGHTPQH